MPGRRGNSQASSSPTSNLKRPRIEPETSSTILRSHQAVNNVPSAFVAETPWLTTIPNSRALQLSIPSAAAIPVNSSTSSSIHPTAPAAIQPAAVKRYFALSRSPQAVSASASNARPAASSRQQQQTSATLPSGDGEWAVWENRRVRNFKRFRKVWAAGAETSSPDSSVDVGVGPGEHSGASTFGAGMRANSQLSLSTARTTWRAVKPFSQRESELPDDNFSEGFAQPLSTAPHATQFVSGRSSRGHSQQSLTSASSQH